MNLLQVHGEEDPPETGLSQLTQIDTRALTPLFTPTGDSLPANPADFCVFTVRTLQQPGGEHGARLVQARKEGVTPAKLFSQSGKMWDQNEISNETVS